MRLLGLPTFCIPHPLAPGAPELFGLLLPAGGNDRLLTSGMLRRGKFLLPGNNGLVGQVHNRLKLGGSGGIDVQFPKGLKRN